MDSQRLVALASVGLALRAASPALLHAMRGCLHDLTMLTALLQPVGALDAADAAKSAQRLDAIDTRLKALERNVGLIAAMIEVGGRELDTVGTTAPALSDVKRLLQDEAARQRVRFAFDVDELPPKVRAEGRGVERALLACGTWMAQHAGAAGALRIVGREEHGDAIFEFDAPALPAEPDAAMREDLRLLAAVVDAAGGRLATAPKLRMSFVRAAG